MTDVLFPKVVKIKLDQRIHVYSNGDLYPFAMIVCDYMIAEEDEELHFFDDKARKIAVVTDYSYWKIVDVEY